MTGKSRRRTPKGGPLLTGAVVEKTKAVPPKPQHEQTNTDLQNAERTILWGQQFHVYKELGLQVNWLIMASGRFFLSQTFFTTLKQPLLETSIYREITKYIPSLNHPLFATLLVWTISLKITDQLDHARFAWANGMFARIDEVFNTRRHKLKIDDPNFDEQLELLEKFNQRSIYILDFFWKFIFISMLAAFINMVYHFISVVSDEKTENSQVDSLFSSKLFQEYFIPLLYFIKHVVYFIYEHSIFSNKIQALANRPTDIVIQYKQLIEIANFSAALTVETSINTTVTIRCIDPLTNEPATIFLLNLFYAMKDHVPVIKHAGDRIIVEQYNVLPTEVLGQIKELLDTSIAQYKEYTVRITEIIKALEDQDYMPIFDLIFTAKKPCWIPAIRINVKNADSYIKAKLCSMFDGCKIHVENNHILVVQGEGIFNQDKIKNVATFLQPKKYNDPIPSVPFTVTRVRAAPADLKILVTNNQSVPVKEATDNDLTPPNWKHKLAFLIYPIDAPDEKQKLFCCVDTNANSIRNMPVEAHKIFIEKFENYLAKARAIGVSGIKQLSPDEFEVKTFVRGHKEQRLYGKVVENAKNSRGEDCRLIIFCVYMPTHNGENDYKNAEATARHYINKIYGASLQPILNPHPAPR